MTLSLSQGSAKPGHDVLDTHAQARQIIRQVIEQLLFGDWQTMSEDDLRKAIARIRQIKIRYLVAGHGTPETDVLSTLNETYLSLCLAFDTLAGRDVVLQERFYRAMLRIEAPLLSIQAHLPGMVLPPEECVPSCEDPQPDKEQLRHADEDELHTGPLQSQAVSDPLLPQRRFRWTPEPTRKLQAELDRLGSTFRNTHEECSAIGQKYGWPAHSVQLKIRQLKKGQPRSGEPGATDIDKEDD